MRGVPSRRSFYWGEGGRFVSSDYRERREANQINQAQAEQKQASKQANISGENDVTYLDFLRVPGRYRPVQITHDHKVQTLQGDEHPVQEARPLYAQGVGELPAVEPVRLGAHEAAAGVGGRLAGQAGEDVVGQDAGGVGAGAGVDVGLDEGLEQDPGAAGAGEPRPRQVRGHTEEVGDPAPEGGVVGGLARTRSDALPGQAEEQGGGGEGEDGAEAVEVVDGDAPAPDVKVARLAGLEGEDAPPDTRVEEADPQGAGEAFAAGPGAVEVLGHLEDMLESLEQAALGGPDAEAARPGEGLHHAAAGHAAYQGLEGQADDGGAAVPVEDVLASLDLVPIHPWRDGVDLCPELIEFGVGGVVLFEEEVEVAARL